MLIPKTSGITEPVHLYRQRFQGAAEPAGAARRDSAGLTLL